MDFFQKIHLFTVIGTMLTELGNWSWDSRFCVMMLVFFVVGCIPQFILLRMRWKPWVISLTLGGLVVFCDFISLCMPGMVHDLLSLLEMFFLAALTGAGLAGAVHIFWEIFKKRPEDEESVWMLRKDKKKEEK